MLFTLYILISLVGVGMLHHAANLYSRREQSGRRITGHYFLWYLCLLIGFGSQQYAIFFDEQVLMHWFFYLPAQQLHDVEVSGGMELAALLFLGLYMLTLPPSKLNRVFGWIRRSS